MVYHQVEIVGIRDFGFSSLVYLVITYNNEVTYNFVDS